MPWPAITTGASVGSPVDGSISSRLTISLSVPSGRVGVATEKTGSPVWAWPLPPKDSSPVAVGALGWYTTCSTLSASVAVTSAAGTEARSGVQPVFAGALTSPNRFGSAVVQSGSDTAPVFGSTAQATVKVTACSASSDTFSPSSVR